MTEKTVYDLRTIAIKQYNRWQRNAFIKALLYAMKESTNASRLRSQRKE